MKNKSYDSTSNNYADDAWLTATGPVPIRMTNDYLFRALLQRSNTALKGLICSLLHLGDEEVISVAIINPIELGKTFDFKDFFLDAKVSLNDQSIVHLEMHVVQIGLLDYTLFPDYPEFYATYELRNRKNHHLYSDKLRLCVLDLSRIDLATGEDRLHKIDYWASLFKATTWEEIKMLAKDNDFINDAAATVYQLTQEETIRLQCEAREDYYRNQRDFELVLDKWKSAAAELSAEKDALVAENEKLLALIAKHGIQLK